MKRWWIGVGATIVLLVLALLASTHTERYSVDLYTGATCVDQEFGRGWPSFHRESRAPESEWAERAMTDPSRRRWASCSTVGTFCGLWKIYGCGGPGELVPVADLFQAPLPEAEKLALLREYHARVDRARDPHEYYEIMGYLKLILDERGRR